MNRYRGIETEEMTSKPAQIFGVGRSLAGARLLARRCPVWRRREPGLRLVHGTWEGRCRYGCSGRFGVATGSASSGGNREALSTVAVSVGGSARSSGDVPVMGAEQRGRLICGTASSGNHLLVGGLG